ncbi:MAG: DUF1934 family protein [Bacilli bacterium]|nr:DUF1934 family protein [Bacilli bacterium]
MSLSIEIKFKMIISHDTQKMEIDFIETGSKYHKNNKTYLKFKEPIIDTNEYNDLTLICSNDAITIIRNGKMRMHQHFYLHEFTTGYYTNEYITTEIKTYTNEYQFTNDFLYLDYDLYIEENKIGRYQMEVRIKGVDYEQGIPITSED